MVAIISNLLYHIFLVVPKIIFDVILLILTCIGIFASFFIVNASYIMSKDPYFKKEERPNVDIITLMITCIWEVPIRMGLTYGGKQYLIADQTNIDILIVRAMSYLFYIHLALFLYSLYLVFFTLTTDHMLGTCVLFLLYHIIISFSGCFIIGYAA